MAMFLIVYWISRLIWKHTPESAFLLRKRWIKWVALPVMNIKVQVEGKQEVQPALYVCNHRSFSDPVINCAYINAFVIAKAEIANYPIINKGAEATGVMWVKRDSMKSRSSTRQAMLDALLGGHNVLVYPEGTVGVQPNTLKFSKGTFAECAKHNIPVVPVAIEYRDNKDMWKNTSFPAHYFKQFAAWRTECKMAIGPAMTGDDGAALALKAQSWVDDKLADMHQDWTRADWQALSKL